MSAATSRDDLGVYVHIPFCERVCPYCDFAVLGVGRLEPERERRYVELLLRELDLLWQKHGPDLADRPLATIYLGGGTPGLLQPGSLERLLRSLEARLGGPAREVTLELNPGTLESGRAAGFRAAGVTRLSIGLQSLHDRTLRRLGRAQKAAEALRGLESCLAVGFDSLSVDLIFGAPEQTEAELFGDLERVIELGVPHVSAYALTIEPGTPFARARERGLLRLPDEETELRMSLGLRARLAEAGYEQYEISSFARPGHRSRHNQRYWACRDVLGLGVSAASLVADLRFQNTRDLAEWETAVAEGRSPVGESRPVSAREARQDFVGLGFRCLDGIRRSDFQRRFGAPLEVFFAAELRELRELDLVADREDSLRLTERGIRFADEVFQRFVGR
ncbi:MAG: radical SAM family heme chaperone HemW [Myxococcota bacterium]